MSLLSQSIAPPTAPFRPFSHPNEVFVGNLSYFCDEYHLYSLFNQYAHVTNVRIVRTDNHSRSLLFGFVAFRSAVEAKEITRLFDRNIFMGRKMKVELSDNKILSKNDFTKFPQVHVAISSFFHPAETIVKPTETLLRRFFMSFGTILDLQVNVYYSHEHLGKQDGYAFITFADEVSVDVVTATAVHYLNGIKFICTRSQHENMKKITSSGEHTLGTSTSASMSTILKEDEPYLPPSNSSIANVVFSTNSIGPIQSDLFSPFYADSRVGSAEVQHPRSVEAQPGIRKHYRPTSLTLNGNTGNTNTNLFTNKTIFNSQSNSFYEELGWFPESFDAFSMPLKPFNKEVHNESDSRDKDLFLFSPYHGNGTHHVMSDPFSGGTLSNNVEAMHRLT